MIDENSLDILARNCSVFESLPALLFAPSKASVDSSEVCEDAVLAEGAVNDTAEDEKTKKEHQFNSIIIPELKRGDDCDITVIGCAVYSLQCSGGKQVEVEKQKEGRLIYGFMDAVKAHPCTQIVGMSSMGPTISVVCKAGTDAHALDHLAAKYGMDLTFTSTVNTTGLRMREVPLPSLVHVIGKPFAGKTTVCRALADVVKEKHVVHFAAGEYLRRFIASNPDADDAETIADIMKRGEVKDREHVTANVLLEELFANIARFYMDNSDMNEPVYALLDGFPRSAEQVQALLSTELGLRGLLSCAVHVSAPDDDRLSREQLRGVRTVGTGEEARAGVRDVFGGTEAMKAALRGLDVDVYEVVNGGKLQEEGEILKAAMAMLDFMKSMKTGDNGSTSGEA